MAIDLSNISPSSVGAYAACPAKLVFDSKFGRAFTSSPNADFGTVCHYQSQLKLGLKVDKEPTPEQVANAMRLPEFMGRPDTVFVEAVNKCAEKAISYLPPLPDGSFWIPEHKVYDKNMLPARKDRSGKEVVYGGSIDVLRSDRTLLADFKFTSKIPASVKGEYLWQMVSYHLVSGVPKTQLIFVTRDAKNACTVTLDFTLPLWKEFASQARISINRMGHADYERYAHPVEGSQCDWCDHKRRCPLKQLPDFITKAVPLMPVANLDILADLNNQIEVNKTKGRSILG